MKPLFYVGPALLFAAAVLAQPAPVTRPAKDSSASRREIRVTARNTVAEVKTPLSEAERAIGLLVYVGTLPCELGQVVHVTHDPDASGFFRLRIRKETYRVSPKETTTGAIRLEDKASGVVWLQLANKSMLMSQKLGRRLVDECVSPTQAVIAQSMLKNPPPSILDALAPTVSAKPVVD